MTNGVGWRNEDGRSNVMGVFMRLKVLNVEDVATAHLCSGCGACAYLDPDVIEMVDEPEVGRRPRRRAGAVMSGQGAAEAMQACPGIGLSHTFDETDPKLLGELRPGWGPVLRLWEGYAADPEIRFAGSSGGAATALAVYAVEQGQMHGVLHTGARDDAPYLNETVFSQTKDELLSRTGSRYAPASPCDGLTHIENAPGPCLFIGKPCDVAAANKSAKLRPQLAGRLGLTVAFFCAGTPSTNGTLAMLRAMGVTSPEDLIHLRYRGQGWPGRATAVYRTVSGERESQLTYEQSWGAILSGHVQWRCRMCADHTGEFADIAVGDPWYREIREGEPGQSLILARTRRGERFVEAAMAAGYLSAESGDVSLLPRSQPNLLRTRGSVWGRVVASRLVGMPAPRYRGMPMFRYWCTELTFQQKVKSIFGTLRRIFGRRMHPWIARRPSAEVECRSISTEEGL